MNWKTLFSTKRIGKTSSLIEDEPLGRSEFQRDLDRIIFSSAFRRLQSKTQVIPIPGSDFVHTRLTHSLETFCVGRSLGQLVGRKICDDCELDVTPDDIAAIVATACMAHDIGNPPLGHSGEDAISEYFLGPGADYIANLPPTQISDFTNFDGNALGFHILAHSLPGQTTILGGMRLTYTTLAAFTKYPNESIISSRYKSTSKHKFGIFQSEIETYKLIADNLKIESSKPEKPKQEITAREWCRHPLAFLVEAADDICYKITDFEDAYRMGVINFTDAKSKLAHIKEIDRKTFNQIRDDNEKIGYLRSRAINELVEEVADCFLDHITGIVRGEYTAALTENIHCSRELKEILDETIKYMYKKRSVIETETSGFEWINGLLGTFVPAVTNSEKSKYDYKVISLIPNQFLNNRGQPSGNKYSDILNITHFIAGMTDPFAIELYRTIKGLSLPSY